MATVITKDERYCRASIDAYCAKVCERKMCPDCQYYSLVSVVRAEPIFESAQRMRMCYYGGGFGEEWYCRLRKRETGY